MESCSGAPQVARDGAGRWCAVVGEGRLDYGPAGPVRTLRRLPIDPTATGAEAEAAAETGSRAGTHEELT